MTVKVIYEESNRLSKSGVITSSIILLLLGCAFCFSTYRMLDGVVSGKVEMLVEGITFLVLLYQAFGRYKITLLEDTLKITEYNLLGRKVLLIPYKLIEGVCTYKRQLNTPLKFRYKHNKMATADDRQVLSLVYAIEGKKIKHGRVLFKASQECLDVLSQKVPNRIGVPEEDVVLHAYIRIDAHKHGEEPEEYLERIKAQSVKEDGTEKKIWEP